MSRKIELSVNNVKKRYPAHLLKKLSFFKEYEFSKSITHIVDNNFTADTLKELLFVVQNKKINRYISKKSLDDLIESAKYLHPLEAIVTDKVLLSFFNTKSSRFGYDDLKAFKKETSHPKIHKMLNSLIKLADDTARRVQTQIINSSIIHQQIDFDGETQELLMIKLLKYNCKISHNTLTISLDCFGSNSLEKQNLQR